MIEFADLQCPFCRDYTLNALPAIVEEYVRPGKVKLVFAGMSFIGPDSETALRADLRRRAPEPPLELPRPPLPEPGRRELGLGHRGPAPLGRQLDPRLRHRGDDVRARDRRGDGAIDARRSRRRARSVNQTPTFFAGPTGRHAPAHQPQLADSRRLPADARRADEMSDRTLRARDRRARTRRCRGRRLSRLRAVHARAARLHDRRLRDRAALEVREGGRDPGRRARARRVPRGLRDGALGARRGGRDRRGDRARRASPSAST